MKSIEMTEETYAGIPADVEAFTLDDETKSAGSTVRI